MKRWFLKFAAVLTAVIMLISVMPLTVYAETGYDRGYKGSMPGNGKIYAEGLDVSFWQGESLDFNNIKSAGYSYVILRCGSTKGKDKCFETYYTKAKAAGLNVGTYYYSYATSESAAAQDAANTLSWISGKTFEYPVYFDYEDSSQQSLSTSAAAAISRKYMDTVRNAGYLVGFYSFKSLMEQSWITSSGIRSTYEGWIARYMNSGNHTDMDSTYSTQYGMYQYTDKKYVNGKGPFDANVCYKDYPSIVRQYGFNGYSAGSSPSSDKNENFAVCSDSYGTVAGGVKISGWCYDKRDTSVEMKVHVYIGGPAGSSNAEGNPFTVANVSRPDVDAAYKCGANHGYDATIFTSKTGRQPVYVYAVNPKTGENGIITSFTVDIPNPNNPQSNLEEISAKTGAVHVEGWSFDKDDCSKTLAIHVYIGGSAGNSNAEGHSIAANVERPDVDAAYKCGANHGFDTDVPTAKTGIQDIYVYAINIHGGSNQLIGSGQVAIPADTEKPVVSESFASPIENQDAYRVFIKATDNVEIKKVMVGTWINGATPPDESTWKSAKQDAEGYWYVDILRSEQSSTGNSFYNNQFYVYDWSDNKTFGTANMDYRVKSETGKSVAEGEYRISPVSDESKGLDVYGAKTDDSTNVDVYPNLADSSQTFRLTYIGDGYYTIFGTNADKPVDVFGDTYLSGTNVCISSYHEGANQQWIITPDASGSYVTIKARSNGLALTAQDDDNVAVCTDTGADNQKWRLRRVLKDASYTVIDPVIIKGKTPEPKVTVKMGDKELVENVDYTVSVTSYSDGKGVVTVTGTGDYCDSKALDFSYSEYLPGDIDMDGFVTITHATELQMYLARVLDLTEDQLKLADADLNGKVNVNDVTKIQAIVAGLN